MWLAQLWEAPHTHSSCPNLLDRKWSASSFSERLFLIWAGMRSISCWFSVIWLQGNQTLGEWAWWEWGTLGPVLHPEAVDGYDDITIQPNNWDASKSRGEFQENMALAEWNWVNHSTDIVNYQFPYMGLKFGMFYANWQIKEQRRKETVWKGRWARTETAERVRMIRH